MLQPHGSMAKTPYQNQLGQLTSGTPISPVGNGTDAAAFFNGIEASSPAAKQLAALNAAGIARRASQSGGTSGVYVGGMSANQHPALRGHDPSNPSAQALSHPPPAPAFPDTAAPADAAALHRLPMQPGQPDAALKAKQQKHNFLFGLSNIMSARNTPLPPDITGISSAYDPSSSRWKHFEVGSEVGTIKFAGKEVDLYKLWTIVTHYGGHARLAQQNLWPNVVQAFGFSEHLPTPQPTGNTSAVHAVAGLYMELLGPVEEAYIRSIQSQNARKAAGATPVRPSQPIQQLTQQPGRMPQPGIPSSYPGQVGQPGPSPAPVMGPAGADGSSPATNSAQYTNMLAAQAGQRAPSNLVNPMGQGQGAQPRPQSSLLESGENPENKPSVVANGVDPNDARKRKSVETDDARLKRRRGTTAERSSIPPVDPSSSTQAAALAARGQPTRQKIEYVPLARQIETAGGRDIHLIETELHNRHTNGKRLLDISDWGTIEVDMLMMSLRSRLSVELSYALTATTLLSSMHGPAEGTGFPLHQCQEFMNELLDLLQEKAFGDTEDDYILDHTMGQDIVTHCQLTKFVSEEEEKLFGGLDHDTHSKKSGDGDVMRPGDIIRMILLILRNFSVTLVNQPFMTEHPELLDLILRVASHSLSPSGFPVPLSPSLTLRDLVAVRKETLYILFNLSSAVRLSATTDPTPQEKCRTRRFFTLIMAYLVDSAEALSPISWLLACGMPVVATAKPPYLADLALEVFTRTSQSDHNRMIISREIPKPWVQTLFEKLVHRLPFHEGDFRIAMGELWLSYIDKLAMAMYSLAFLMPPDLKKKIKSNRSLGFAPILLRFVKKFTLLAAPEVRQLFAVSARRAIETMKLIDDCHDSFDTSQPSVPTLSFGVGYGEVDDGKIEKGTGLLGGRQEDVTMGIMMFSDLDDVMFSELESLARVEHD